MHGTRRVYTQEFTQEAVALIARHDKSAKQVARALGIDPSALRRWRQDCTAQTGTVERAGSTEETGPLRRELERVRMERDILKKAVAFFAKESR